jgi:hypothetical protein
VRLIEVLYKGKGYRYLTNELDPAPLPTEYVVALPAYQLALPFSPSAWREMALCTTLTGTTL